MLNTLTQMLLLVINDLIQIIDLPLLKYNESQ